MPTLRLPGAKRKFASRSGKRRRLVPVEGIEPPCLAARDFESRASTSSATRALAAFYIVRGGLRQRKSGFLAPGAPYSPPLRAGAHDLLELRLRQARSPYFGAAAVRRRCPRRRGAFAVGAQASAGRKRHAA